MKVDIFVLSHYENQKFQSLRGDSMAAKDLGNKHVCFKCSTKFYDLKKPEPLCPKCGADQRESPANKPSESRRGRLAAVPKVIEPVAAEEEAETELDEEADEDLDDFDDADEEVPADDED
jgi:uncharacterized protein (TIGR02300 family)